MHSNRRSRTFDHRHDRIGIKRASLLLYLGQVLRLEILRRLNQLGKSLF